MTFIKVCLHCSIFAFLIYIIVLAKPGTSLFSFHPLCMTLAYGVLMTEGVLAFSPGSFFGPETPRSTLFYYHWLFNTLAGVVATAGFIIIYWNKTRKEIQHFATYHGLLGLISVLYTIVQLIAGFALKYKSILPKWIKYKVMKHLHMVSGLVAYSLGLISLILAFASNWYSKNGFALVDIACLFLYGAVLLFLSNVVLQKTFSFLSESVNFNRSKKSENDSKQLLTNEK